MPRFRGFTLVWLATIGVAHAQIPTSGNIFLGYAYSHTNSSGGTVNLNGWEGSLEGKFLPWIGIVADFSAGYGSNDSLPIACPVSACLPAPILSSTSVTRYTYLIGPRVSIPVKRFTPFAHVLFGAAHLNDRGNSDTCFASALGGGLDYRLIHGLAWRIQGDQLHTDFFSVGESHFRFSTGIDVRF
jgi:hypothetical protein